MRHVSLSRSQSHQSVGEICQKSLRYSWRCSAKYNYYYLKHPNAVQQLLKQNWPRSRYTFSWEEAQSHTHINSINRVGYNRIAFICKHTNIRKHHMIYLHGLVQDTIMNTVHRIMNTVHRPTVHRPPHYSIKITAQSNSKINNPI